MRKNIKEIKACYSLRIFCCNFPAIFYVYIDFREKGKKEREGNVDVRNSDCLSPVHSPIGGQIHNLGMCPDQRSNPQHFGIQDDAPSN